MITIKRNNGAVFAQVYQVTVADVVWHHIDLPSRATPLDPTNSFNDAWFHVTVAAMREYKEQLRIRYCDDVRHVHLVVTPASSSDARESQMKVARNAISKWMQ